MIITHAQNLEDVMLWRALGDVENGFYVDIGAMDPTDDSVSKIFYDHGWRGVHVEPNLEFAARLRAGRPDELVMEVAVSDFSGVIAFHDIPDTGLSTTVSALAEDLEREGFPAQSRLVPCLTLQALLEPYRGREVHFLKIDVEGNEPQVIRGHDWQSVRPWILVVEATLPRSQLDAFDDWEPTLLAADYHFVYADGLNRFYLAGAHLGLREKFKYPANFFDNYKRADHVAAEAAAATWHASAHQHAMLLKASDIACNEAVAAQAALRQELQASESRAARAEARAAYAEARAAAQGDALAHWQQASVLYAQQAGAMAAQVEALRLAVLTLAPPTGPRAVLRHLLRGRFGAVLLAMGMTQARAERLQRVAGTGAAPKRAARLVFYIVSRAVLRVPGLRRCLLPVKRVSPALWGRLRDRHKLHHAHAAAAPPPPKPAAPILGSQDLPKHARALERRLNILISREPAA
jgi:FkbM family methyltransferase